MSWTIRFEVDFLTEFERLDPLIQDELIAQLRKLQRFGPALGRPSVDTLKGSRHHNMKELRFDACHGVWRVAFAFDRSRMAVLLIAGDKSGVSEQKFYRGLIKRADERFDRYLMKGDEDVQDS